MRRQSKFTLNLGEIVENHLKEHAASSSSESEGERTDGSTSKGLKSKVKGVNTSRGGRKRSIEDDEY